jgi:hypothetical protein
MSSRPFLGLVAERGEAVLEEGGAQRHAGQIFGGAVVVGV